MSTSLSALNQQRLMASARLNHAIQNADQAVAFAFKVQKCHRDLKKLTSQMPPTVLVQVQDQRLMVKVFEHQSIDTTKAQPCTL